MKKENKSFENVICEFSEKQLVFKIRNNYGKKEKLLFAFYSPEYGISRPGPNVYAVSKKGKFRIFYYDGNLFIGQNCDEVTSAAGCQWFVFRQGDCWKTQQIKGGPIVELGEKLDKDFPPYATLFRKQREKGFLLSYFVSDFPSLKLQQRKVHSFIGRKKVLSHKNEAYCFMRNDGNFLFIFPGYEYWLNFVSTERFMAVIERETVTENPEKVTLEGKYYECQEEGVYRLYGNFSAEISTDYENSSCAVKIDSQSKPYIYVSNCKSVLLSQKEPIVVESNSKTNSRSRWWKRVFGN